MLKYLMAGLGWLIIVSAGSSIAIRLFGADDAVLSYAGSSRNLDSPLIGLAVGLVFICISAILDRLDNILNRDEE